MSILLSARKLCLVYLDGSSYRNGRHLAPHVQNTERRNADWQECVQRLRFDDNRSVYDTDMLLVYVF